MSELRTATGKAQLAEMWPDDAPMDSLRMAYAQTLAAIEAEAGALERERITKKARAAHDLFKHGSIVMRHAVYGSWEACDTQPCRWVRALLDEPTP